MAPLRRDASSKYYYKIYCKIYMYVQTNTINTVHFSGQNPTQHLRYTLDAIWINRTAIIRTRRRVIPHESCLRYSSSSSCRISWSIHRNSKIVLIKSPIKFLPTCNNIRYDATNNATTAIIIIRVLRASHSTWWNRVCIMRNNNNNIVRFCILFV